MIEMTIAAHSAAEIHVIAEALQRIANIRRQEEIPTGEQDPIVPFVAPVADTVTVVEPAPAEAPKRRGRPPKSDAPTPAASETAPAEPAQPEPAAEFPSEPAPAPATAPAAPALTLETVRAKAASVSQAGKAAAVKALLTQMGAAKLTDLDSAKYPEFLEQLEAV